MEEKEQARFDAWWLKNRAKLITIYNNEIDLSMAILEIAEAAWEDALNAENDSIK